MYHLEKTVVISSAHHLENYNGVCRNVHGHNWKITVYCKGKELDDVGMLIDFRKIDQTVKLLDHTNLNVHFRLLNPTAENIAKWICDKISFCYKVTVEETEGSKCTYEKEE